MGKHFEEQGVTPFPSAHPGTADNRMTRQFRMKNSKRVPQIIWSLFDEGITRFPLSPRGEVRVGMEIGRPRK